MSDQDFKNLPAPQSGTHPPASDDLSCWLEAALHATSGGGESGDPSNDELLKELLEIRRGHLGEAFEFSPVGQQMVEAVLNARYRAKSSVSMSKAIIDSLGNDPVCRERLELLWNQLGTAVGV